MLIFRAFLVGVFLALNLYTVAVLSNHEAGLLDVFFGDMAKFGWAGQFNADFMSMLAFSAIWVAWRNSFSPLGLGLAVVAFFGGGPFLCAYLFYLSFACGGNVRQMLVGNN